MNFDFSSALPFTSNNFEITSTSFDPNENVT